jgi:lipoxygenase
MAAPCRELITDLRQATVARPPPGSRRAANELCLVPPLHQRRLLQRGRKVVAAISEDLPRLAAAVPGSKGRPKQTEKVAVRAALTVRRKQEDLKEAAAGHLDALLDMVGRSVKLELISTKIHPSKLPRRLLLFCFAVPIPFLGTISSLPMMTLSSLQLSTC